MSTKKRNLKNPEQRKKQKKIFAVIAVLGVGIIGMISFWPEESQKSKDVKYPMPPGFTEEAFPYQNPNFNAEKARLRVRATFVR